MPASTTWDSKKFVPFDAVAAAPHTLGPAQPAGAVDWQGALNAVWLPCTNGLNDSSDALPAILHVCLEAPLVADGCQLAELTRVLKAQI